MKTPLARRRGAACLLAGLAALCGPCACAEAVYKCVSGGKTSFTSAPKDAGGNCQSMELNTPEPNPVDVAREQERIREYQQEKKADAARRRKEPDPEAQRRQQETELAKSVARAPVPSPATGGRGRRRGARRGGLGGVGAGHQIGYHRA